MIFEILIKKEPYLIIIQSDYKENKTIDLLINIHGITPFSILELDTETVEENDIYLKISKLAE